MKPQLVVGTRRVLTQIHRLVVSKRCIGRAGIVAYAIRIPEIGELADLALATVWTWNAHGVAPRALPALNAGWVGRRVPSHREGSRWQSGRGGRRGRARAIHRAQADVQNTSPRRAWP